MDPVRFGRALGVGTREAAKALKRAADAAAAPNPGARASSQQPSGQSVPSGGQPSRRAASVAAKGVVQARSTLAGARQTAAGVRRGGKRFGEAVWGPVVKLSGVLWLEVTGVFFGLFALVAGLEVWKRRADLAAAGDPRNREWFLVIMLTVFSYFTISSFVRAHRRGRS